MTRKARKQSWRAMTEHRKRSRKQASKRTKETAEAKDHYSIRGSSDRNGTDLTRLVAMVNHLIVADHLLLVQRGASDRHVSTIRRVKRPRAWGAPIRHCRVRVRVGVGVGVGAKRSIVLHRLVWRCKVRRRCHARLCRYTSLASLSVVLVVDVRILAAFRDLRGTVKHVVAIATLPTRLNHAQCRVGEHRVACVGVEALSHAVHIAGAKSARTIILRGTHEHLVVLIRLGINKSIREAR